MPYTTNRLGPKIRADGGIVEPRGLAREAGDQAAAPALVGEPAFSWLIEQPRLESFPLDEIHTFHSNPCRKGLPLAGAPNVARMAVGFHVGKTRSKLLCKPPIN